MDIMEILGIVIGLPILIFVITRLVLQSIMESMITDILLQISGMPPIVIAIISFLGIIGLIAAIISIVESFFS